MHHFHEEENCAKTLVTSWKEKCKSNVKEGVWLKIGLYHIMLLSLTFVLCCTISRKNFYILSCLEIQQLNNAVCNGKILIKWVIKWVCIL